jgi:hypothetical protein
MSRPESIRISAGFRSFDDKLTTVSFWSLLISLCLENLRFRLVVSPEVTDYSDGIFLFGLIPSLKNFLRCFSRNFRLWILWISCRRSLILLVSENVKDLLRSVLMFVIVLSRTSRLCTVFWYNRIRRRVEQSKSIESHRSTNLFDFQPYEFYFKKLRKLTLKQISTEHHVSNLRAYIANNIIPKGLHIKLTPQSHGWKSNRFVERT